MLKSYQAGISAMRWLTFGGRIPPVLQYGLRPINGGDLDWFNVPTQVANATVSPERPEQCRHGARSEAMCSVCSRER